MRPLGPTHHVRVNILRLRRCERCWRCGIRGPRARRDKWNCERREGCISSQCSGANWWTCPRPHRLVTWWQIFVRQSRYSVVLKESVEAKTFVLWMFLLGSVSEAVVCTALCAYLYPCIPNFIRSNDHGTVSIPPEIRLVLEPSNNLEVLLQLKGDIRLEKQQQIE